MSQEIEIIDSGGKLFTSKVVPATVRVKCLLCDSILETYLDAAYDRYPYICEDCKEAIAYAKYLQRNLDLK